MAHNRKFRFTLATLLVIVIAGAAWMSAAQSGQADSVKFGGDPLMPTIVETITVLPQGALAWDCPGCPNP